MKTYLTMGDVASILDVSSNRVRHLVNRGDLSPAARTTGGTRLFTRAAVIRYQMLLPIRRMMRFYLPTKRRSRRRW